MDDISPDGTGDIADQLSKDDNRIYVEHRNGPRGLGRAYIHGFKWALQHDYEYIFEMDADFSHQPKYLPYFLKQPAGRSRIGMSMYTWWRYRRMGSS